jgi:hypothetical protein
MFLITKSGRRKAICTECRKLHAAKDCPKSRPFMPEPITMKEFRLREKWEQICGRSLSWSEVYALARKTIG